MAARNFADTSDLPWPECLGTFDEESCRFFLRELGQKVVQNYPFSIGMEEVFAQIVDEYGIEGSADVISVLQELLEDESVAAGVGDDGDIWRSWRYNWRHRNDDPLNPYIPRARGCILGPPTTTRIRLLKNANFVQVENLLSAVKDSGLALVDVNVTRLSETDRADHGSEKRHRTLSAERSPLQGNSRRISAMPIGKGSLHGMKPILESQSTYDLSKADLKSSEEHTSLAAKRYEQSIEQAISNPPRKSMPTPYRKHEFPFHLTSPRRKTCLDSQDEKKCADVSAQPQKVNLLSSESPEKDQNKGLPVRPRSPVENSAMQIINEAVERTLIPSRHVKTEENRLSLPSELSMSEVEVTPCRRRALHRQARMIDGAIFHPRTRKGKIIESEIGTDGSPVKLASERAMNRLSSHSAQTTSTTASRASWLHNVLNRFRKQKDGKQQTKLHKQHLNPAGCTKAMHANITTPLERPSIAPEAANMSYKPPLPATFGFNGVSEFNNKPLPLSPAQEGRKSMASETQRFFQQDYQGFESNKSIFDHSAFSIQGENDMSSLVSATMIGPQELSPQEKRWKYNSSTSSHDGPSSPSSFATFAKKNPYNNSSTPSTPEIDPPSPLTYCKHEVSSSEWPFRVQHDSSPNAGCEKPTVSATVIPSYPASKTVNNVHPILTEEDEQRGRRPGSPDNSLKAKFGLSPSKKPRPRSRSPVKRLLGMVKSSSANHIPIDDSSTKTTAASSTNKKKWKELSHKVKHGFLTADLEQLSQEEMMTQYMSSDANVDAVRIITPPSRGDRPTFPVSLKSAGQNILWSELEFALIETANTFLKNELQAGRLTRDSILRVKHQWQAKNRPQVVEFYYDLTTQCELILANLRSVKLYSDYSQDAVMLNSVLHQWKILIRELSVKTLCMPDSVVRRWIHDGRRVLELLGAPHQCLLKFDKVSTLCVSVINSHERERAKTRKASNETETNSTHRRSASDGSQKSTQVHEAALMALRPLYGQDARPPLPTSTPLTSNVRKLTPHERTLAYNLKQNQEYKWPVNKHFQSASLPGIRQRG